MLENGIVFFPFSRRRHRPPRTSSFEVSATDRGRGRHVSARSTAGGKGRRSLGGKLFRQSIFRSIRVAQKNDPPTPPPLVPREPLTEPELSPPSRRGTTSPRLRARVRVLSFSWGCRLAAARPRIKWWNAGRRCPLFRGGLDASTPHSCRHWTPESAQTGTGFPLSTRSNVGEAAPL